MSRVSVLIPHYNQPILIVSAIESIMRTCLSDVQILVADDHSSEDNYIQLRHVLEYLANKTNLNIRLFRSDVNVGTYRLKNDIINRIDTEFITFHDADDYSVPMRLDCLYNLMNKNIHIDILGSSYIDFYQNFHTVNSFRIKKFYRIPYIAHQLGKKYLSFQPSQLIRFSIFRTLGGFDGTTRIAADDDFLLRAIHCVKVRNINRPLYVKIERESSLTTSSVTGFQSETRLNYIKKLDQLRNTIKSNLPLSEYMNKPNDVRFHLNEIELK
ncbi:glycosyltransferase family 2 protein [Photorhabdus heterorhabditis]|uniref:glycosyltransferase family 2 protein n=1 Tax=Photorhabdus heterorhabditis TaxID=880156 RepID=UPI001561E111|nr:glycosyltransferase [Photorhabdus heterorhabditis]NRN29052.1 glycosyltransferase [Photorhabdus heterorhabditis subsp. aluminescens]